MWGGPRQGLEPEPCVGLGEVMRMLCLDLLLACVRERFTPVLALETYLCSTDI